MIVARLEPFSTRIERAYDAPVLYGMEAHFISLSAMELTRCHTEPTSEYIRSPEEDVFPEFGYYEDQ